MYIFFAEQALNKKQIQMLPVWMQGQSSMSKSKIGHMCNSN